MGAAFSCCATTTGKDDMTPRSPTTERTTTDVVIHPADADCRLAIMRHDARELQQLVLDTCGDGSTLELDRVAMPGKGTTTWSIPTPVGEQHPATLRGVILAAQPRRTYWSGEYDGGHAPPDCASRDGVVGLGTPGGVCRVCPLSMFGDDRTSPACTERMDLTFLGLDEDLPSIVKVHKMSVKPVREYLRLLRRYRLEPAAVITELGLQAAQYRNRKPYTRLTLRAIGRLSPTEQAGMRTVLGVFGFGSAGPADAGNTSALAGEASVTARVPGEDDIPAHAALDLTEETDTPPGPSTDDCDDVPL
jgi:hypothetical protein